MKKSTYLCLKFFLKFDFYKWVVVATAEFLNIAMYGKIQEPNKNGRCILRISNSNFGEIKLTITVATINHSTLNT